MALDFRSYLVHTLLNFYHQIMQPENSAFMRLVLEQSQRNPELAQHIHERGPVHVQSAIATALEQAECARFIALRKSAIFGAAVFWYFAQSGMAYLMGIPVQEDDQEIDELHQLLCGSLFRRSSKSLVFLHFSLLIVVLANSVFFLKLTNN